MRKLLITINWKLFHSSDRRPVGGMIATVAPDHRIKLRWSEIFERGHPDAPLPDMRGIAQVIRLHVRTYLRDTRYTIFWNENTGIETLVNELP